MIRKNQKQLNRLNVLSDGIIVYLSYLFSSWYWLDHVRNIDGNIAAVDGASSASALAAALYAVWTVAVLGWMRVYRTTRIHSMVRELRSIVLGNAISVIMVAAALYLFRLVDFSRGVLAIFYLTVVVLLIGKRVAVRTTLRFIRAKGYNLKHMLVVGGGRLARRYADTVHADKALGIQVADIIKPSGDFVEALERRLHGDEIDEVILALEPEELGVTIQVIQLCEKSGTKVCVVPFYNDVIPTRAAIDNVGSIKLIQLRTTPLDEPFNAMLKRAFDIAASLILLILLSPLMLFLAVAVWLSSPGPVLFRQERVGRNKRPFTMLKFRSMQMNPGQDTAWTTDGDARRTRIGSLMRKTSLDELPQLWNTLKGDMSLIGPRPEIPYFVEQFRETVPLYMVKYQVRPGMTGWAQINGFRGDTSIRKRIECDVWYIENWSVGLDLRILFKTVFGGMINREKLYAKAETENPNEHLTG